MTHSVESYQDAKGENRWRIKSNGLIVGDSGEGYTDERNALSALFGIFFGEYDESFLELYSRWQSYAGVQHAPEVYVRTQEVRQRDADAPNYEATPQDSATATVVTEQPELPLYEEGLGSDYEEEQR